MQMVTVNDLRMAVDDRGGRQPLILIHGYPLDGAIWSPQVEALSNERRVIAPDLMGCGRSQPAARTSVDDHADDLAALMDALVLRRAVIGGVSMGGYVALAMWRRHPGRISGLVLANTRAGADTEAARAGRYQTATSVAEQGTAAVVEGLLPKLLSGAAGSDVVAEVKQIMARQSPAAVIDALKAMAGRPDSTGILAGITVPTLVITGADDGLLPPSESNVMADLIPGAELVILPGAGHLANFEAPGAFNSALRAFMGRADAASAA